MDIITQLRANWKLMSESSFFRNAFILNFLFFTAVSFTNFHYLRTWEFRTGSTLNDPILVLLSPRDFSLPLFCITYSCIVIGIITVLRHPLLFFRGLLAYSFMLAARTITIYLLPLEAPAGLIPLKDYVADFFLHTPQVFVVKDLFFSGHTGALMIMYLATDQKWFRKYVSVALIVVPLLLMWQHVHYAIDVVAAYPLTWGCYKVAERITANFFQDNLQPQEQWARM